MAETAEASPEDWSPKSSRSAVGKNANLLPPPPSNPAGGFRDRETGKRKPGWGRYSWGMERDVGDRTAEESPVTVANASMWPMPDASVASVSAVAYCRIAKIRAGCFFFKNSFFVPSSAKLQRRSRCENFGFFSLSFQFLNF